MKPGIALVAMVAMCPELIHMLPAPRQKTTRLFTHADEERIKKAEAKRERKAQKRGRKQQ